MPGSVRVGAAWLLAIAFVILARPTAALTALGGGVAVAGLALRAWAAGCIDKGGALAVGGPYAHTRNPLYLGSFVIGTGISLAGGHWAWPLAFAAAFGAVYVPTMRREAEELAERFGELYRDYAAAVPGFAVRLSPYRGPESPSGFRWGLYLRYREWEAALGVGVLLGLLALKLRIAG